eukprot:COSAG03_NODE_11534_length_587_cov_1.655738_1_plen_73_part_10
MTPLLYATESAQIPWDDVHVLANQVAGREHFDGWSDSPERVDVLLCQEVALRTYQGGGARVRVNIHRVQLGVL